MKELYTENYKTLIKEIEEDTKIMERYPMFINLILLKHPYHSKLSIDSIQSLSKFQWNFPQRWGKKNNPKIHIEPQKTMTSQSNLEKEEQSWRHHTS